MNSPKINNGRKRGILYLENRLLMKRYTGVEKRIAKRNKNNVPLLNFKNHK